MAAAEAIQVLTTEAFDGWLEHLRDGRAVVAIDARKKRLSQGNLGDFKSVGKGIFEMRIDLGPGYRIYFTRIGKVVVLLLCGGNKSSQAADIALAGRLAAEAKEMIGDSEA